MNKKKNNVIKRAVPQGWKWQRRYSDIKEWIIDMVCPHDIGHDKGIHGCDGCCSILYTLPNPKSKKK